MNFLPRGMDLAYEICYSSVWEFLYKWLNMCEYVNMCVKLQWVTSASIATERSWPFQFSTAEFRNIFLPNGV